MAANVKLEICNDSAEGAVAAQEGGADRVELCDNLVEGGTTPSAGTIQLARKHIDIGLNVIIRPRGGDFLFSDIEFDVMKRDIEVAAENGADGVVIGLLNSDGTIDAQRSGVLVEMARPLSVTFHRAFDMASDPTRALDALIGLGIDRVLTSGQEFSALEGLGLITDLVRQAGGRLIVMPGGEINEENVAQVVEQSGVREVHVSARSAVQSRMVYRNPRCAMGSEYHPDEYAWKTADASRVRALVEAIA